MPSANKTPNIGLNNWEGNEYVKRQDFINDNLKIDEKFGEVDEHLGEKVNYTDLTPVVTAGTGSAYTVTIPTNMVEVTIVPHVNNLADATLNGIAILDREGNPIEKDALKTNIPTKLVRVGSNFFIASGGIRKWGISNVGYSNTSPSTIYDISINSLNQFHMNKDLYDEDLNFIKTVNFGCYIDGTTYNYGGITIRRGDIWTSISGAYATAIREVSCQTFDCKSETETYITTGKISDCGVPGGKPTGWILCEDGIHAYVGFEYGQVYSVIKLNLDTYEVVERLTLKTEQQRRGNVGKYFFCLKNTDAVNRYYDILGIVNNDLIVINSISFPGVLNGFNYMHNNSVLMYKDKFYVLYQNSYSLKLVAIFNANTNQLLGTLELNQISSFNPNNFNIKDGLGVVVDMADSKYTKTLKIVDDNLNKIYETKMLSNNCTGIYINSDINTVIPKTELNSDFRALYKLKK
ncbi:MAG TPA: hypothetical protein DCR69_12380 [Clostridium sp.]|nr:hypothetical protein [Clostridium sp.]